VQEAARLMAEELRDTDFLSRYGGEEPALLVTQTAGATARREAAPHHRARSCRWWARAAGFGDRLDRRRPLRRQHHHHLTPPTALLYDAKAAGKDCVRPGRGLLPGGDGGE
jgi:GGDEF domain-containing protein